MKIVSVIIQNFRKLLNCRIDVGEKTTLFVGANNSGKTSAMDALAKFLANRSFCFNDITISKRADIEKIGEKWQQKDFLPPNDLLDWESIVPKMDIWLNVNADEYQYIFNLIPTLNWEGGLLGVRLALFPKDISKLFSDYQEAYFASPTNDSIKLFPKDLCDFLDRKIGTYFSIKTYILDPKEFEKNKIQDTPFDSECTVDNPLKGVIKVDMIDAQRGFSDPDHLDSGNTRKQLSEQMRNYYEKHLDPEKSPTLEDLEMLGKAEEAREVFEKGIISKFEPIIMELEKLGYPGINNPKITITSKVETEDTLKHDSAIQYALSKTDDSLKLPEKYNGLGYQNLISMFFDLISFRDDWIHVGKAKSKNMTIEPIHLVLIEEPEAHLHIQVQQVFARKAYDFLIKGDFLEQNSNFTTQLIISTHSSHIAREISFEDLRYFKRLVDETTCGVATSKVINLCDVFGNTAQTNKFITRYIQANHCDLFFADAVILVEGSAERMLIPHFIRYKYPKLYQSYITILDINGRHIHRLSPLIEKLCMPSLIITDLDPIEENSLKSAVPKRKKKLKSGNYAITEIFIHKKNLDELLDLPSKEKVIEYKTPYHFQIRIAYQTPIKIFLKGKQKEAIARTFEDALIYSNLPLFEAYNPLEDSSGLIGKIKEIFEGDCKNIHKKIYDLLHKNNFDKAGLALDLIYEMNPEELSIPFYIKEGLDWLQNYLYPGEEKSE